MHIYVFVSGHNTPVTEMTQFRAQIAKGGGNIKISVLFKSGQRRGSTKNFEAV